MLLSNMRFAAGGMMAIGLFLLVVQTSEVMGISCYQCNSEYDPRCGVPFDAYSLATINCSLKTPLEHMPHLKPTLCRKTIQKVYGKVRIVRECGYIKDDERDDKACVKRSGTHDVFAVYCSCTTDLCNSSPSIWPNYFTILLCITGVIMVAYNEIINPFHNWRL